MKNLIWFFVFSLLILSSNPKAQWIEQTLPGDIDVTLGIDFIDQNHGVMGGWHFNFGGKIFGNSPDENFSQKVNRKMYRAGLASIFSQLVRDGRMTVVDNLDLDTPKTKVLAQKMKDMGMGMDRVLIITDNMDENLYLSSRNMANVLVLEAHQADPVSLIRFPKILVTRNAIAKIEELLA